MTKRFSMGIRVGLGLLIVFTSVSCDDFYSTSWGKEREYDLSKIHLTRSNLQDFKDAAVGNPKLAGALVDKIIGELDNKTGAERAEFQEVGIDLAIEQSGIGMKIIEVAGSDLSNIDNEEDLKDLLSKVQKGGDSSSIDKAGDNIAKIISGDLDQSTISPGDIPEFKKDSEYAKTADPADVGMAIMVLTLGVGKDFNDLGSDSFWDSLSMELDDNKVKIKPGASPKEVALAAYLNLIVDDTSDQFADNLITGAIRDNFFPN